MPINLNSIKTENLKAFFSALEVGETVTRADIAEATSLSIVTVGKIADALIEAGALTEEKRIIQSAGRRAGLLCLNKKKVVVVIDRSSECTTVTFYSAAKLILWSYTYPKGESLDDIFASTAMEMLNRFDTEDCLGICILSDNNDEWESIGEKTEAFFPGMRYITEFPVRAAALAASGYSSSYKLCMYISVLREHIRGAFIMNGQFVPRQHERYSDFGVIRISNCENLIERLAKAKNDREYAGIIGGTLFNASRITYPDRIVVEIEDRENVKELVDEIREYVSVRCKEIGDTPPEIIYPEINIKCSHYGVLRLIGEKWIDAIVEGK